MCGRGMRGGAGGRTPAALTRSIDAAELTDTDPLQAACL